MDAGSLGHPIIAKIKKPMSFFNSIPIWGWLDIFSNVVVFVALCGESHWALKWLIPNKSTGKTSVKWRREKLKKKFEFLLILGIAGEVGCLPLSIYESSTTNFEAKQAEVVAGQANERASVTESNNLALRSNVAALELQVMETRTNMANMDPRNLPIVSIIGQIRVEVRSPFKDFAKNAGIQPMYSDSDLPLSDQKELNKGEGVLFFFGKIPVNPEIPSTEELGSDISVSGWVGSCRDVIPDSPTKPETIRFDIFLDSSRINAPVNNPTDLTFNSLKYVQFYLPYGEAVPPVMATSGRISLLINGFFPKTFLILPQTNQLFSVFAVQTNEAQISQK